MTYEEADTKAKLEYGPKARVEEFTAHEAKDLLPGTSCYWIGIEEDELGFSGVSWEAAFEDAKRRDGRH
jgi:hypothetical protein